jgi:2-hydroxy-6-oxonona-2,4-dienedioate hydrolase
LSTLWVDLLGAEVKYYDAGGLRTRCIEAGSGEPLLLLHSSDGHAEIYARNVVPLAEQFRVCAIDRPGAGLSARPDRAFDAADYAQHLVDFMDAAGIDRAHIVGQSLGGWLACWTALLHPDRVRKLVAIVAAGLAVDADPAAQAREQEGLADLRRRNEAFAREPTKENLRGRLEWLCHDPSQITTELVELRWALYEQPGARDARAQRRQGGSPIRAPYLLTPERLREIPAPLLFLWTEFNPTTPVATARRAQAAVPGSRFVELEGCAHWPQWERPDAFHAVVREWLLS